MRSNLYDHSARILENGALLGQKLSGQLHDQNLRTELQAREALDGESVAKILGDAI